MFFVGDIFIKNFKNFLVLSFKEVTNTSPLDFDQNIYSSPLRFCELMLQYERDIQYLHSKEKRFDKQDINFR